MFTAKQVSKRNVQKLVSTLPSAYSAESVESESVLKVDNISLRVVGVTYRCDKECTPMLCSLRKTGYVVCEHGAETRLAHCFGA
jgi:hypothetical protein